MPDLGNTKVRLVCSHWLWMGPRLRINPETNDVWCPFCKSWQMVRDWK